MICNIAICLLMTYTISTNFINGIFRPCRVYKSIQYLFTKTFSFSSYSLFSNITPFFYYHALRGDVVLVADTQHAHESEFAGDVEPLREHLRGVAIISARRLDRISDVSAEVQQELGQLELEVEYADHVISVVAEIEILADISGWKIFAAYSVIHSVEPAVKIFVSAVAYAGAAVRFKLIVKLLHILPTVLDRENKSEHNLSPNKIIKGHRGLPRCPFAFQLIKISAYSEAAVASKSSPEFGFWQYFIEAL